MSLKTPEIVKLYSEHRYSKKLLKSWDEYSKLVADAYAEAPSFDSGEVGRWESLASWVNKRFNQVFKIDEAEQRGKGRIHVEFVHAQPYENHDQIFQDIHKNNHLYVSTEYNEHPVWDTFTNAKFRAIHDKEAHYDHMADFSMGGEITAYNAHVNSNPPRNSIPALFTEVVGQAAYYVNYGSFPEQKIAILSQFDPVNLGTVEGYDVQDKELIPQTEDNYQQSEEPEEETSESEEEFFPMAKTGKSRYNFHRNI